MGRKLLLKDGMKQVKAFASSWTDCMGELESKKKELEDLDTVGVDIDTVKQQLHDYKVHAKNADIAIFLLCNPTN